MPSGTITGKPAAQAGRIPNDLDGGHPVTRDQVISMYVSKDEKKHLETEANEADETLSSYVYKLMQAERERQGLDKAARDLNAEERIERTITEATDTLEDTAKALREMQVRSGVYSIAAYELLQNDVLNYSWEDSRAQRARQAGSRRLQLPFEEHSSAVGGDGSDESNENDDSGPKGVDDLV